MDTDHVLEMMNLSGVDYILQEFISQADSQAAVPRNSPGRCIELERAKLASRAANAELRGG